MKTLLASPLLLLVSVSFLTIPASASPKSLISESGGAVNIHGKLRVDNGLETGKYVEIVNVSTPSTPSINKARIFVDSHTVSALFDDGSIAKLNGVVSGDITAVTAGYGLVGGGATGDVTLGLNPTTTDFMKADAKVSLSTGTMGALSYQVSLSSQVMGVLNYKISNSTGVVGVRVIQVVSTTSVTSFSSTSTSFVQTNLKGSITPSSTSSNILVFVTATGENSAGTNNTHFTLMRNGSNVAGSDGIQIVATNAAGLVRAPVSLVVYDSPSSASSVNYAVGLRVSGGTGYLGDGANNTQTMVMVEVAP